MTYVVFFNYAMKYIRKSALQSFNEIIINKKMCNNFYRDPSRISTRTDARCEIIVQAEFTEYQYKTFKNIFSSNGELFL